MTRFSATRLSFYTISIIVFSYILFLGTLPTDKAAKVSHQAIYSKSQIFPQSGNEATLENCPWPIAKIPNLIRGVEEFDETERYIFSDFSYSNGMGNQMFQVASLISIAKLNQAKLIVPESIGLRRGFEIGNNDFLVFVNNSTLKQLRNQYSEFRVLLKDCCSFQEFSQIFEGHQRNFVELDGYFQNFKYFHPNHQDLIKKSFQFLKPVKKLAFDFLETVKLQLTVRSAKLIENNFGSDDQALEIDEEATPPTLVGIHIRHGIDITMNSRNRKFGHVEAPIEFFKNAIKEMLKSNPNSAFIICSDNLFWSRKSLNLGKEIAHFYCPGPREVDMAILTMCDNLIISTGTFGWWSAYLNVYDQPEIQYYKNWPKSGSLLDRMINKSQFFLKEWKALE